MSPVAAGAKTAAKRALRGYGLATSRLRGLPDFMIIGTKRGGTTSLYRYLTEHPDVLPMFPARQRIKGTYFFDVNYLRGVGWYRSHFRTRFSKGNADRPRVTGESSPYYLFHPLAAARASKVAPNARLIVLLRDPVDRAYSQWREQVRRGFEDLSFEEALAAEPGRLAGEEERIIGERGYYSHEHEHHSYVAQGRYARSLRRWLDAFPRERFLFLRSEDLYRDPPATYTRVLEFLGLGPFLPAGYEAYNYHPGEDMDSATRTRLAQEFAGSNRELAALDLGLDLSEWSSERGAARGS